MTITTLDAPHAEITPTGVRFDQAITIDEWEAIGDRLERADRGLRWVIGDWLVYGSDRFGARAAVIADALSLATGSVANAASVCRRVPHERRRGELSFAHHEEVAHLDAGEQARMLQTAVDEGLSKSVLRQLVHEQERERKTSPPADDGDDEPSTSNASDQPSAPRARAVSETVTFRITGGHVDPDVLADGVARIREGLETWLAGHGYVATVEVEP